MTTMVSIDLGASSGRVMAGAFDGERLAIQEAHRFRNVPLTQDGQLRWDVRSLLSEATSGLQRAAQLNQAPIASVGVDGWGLDFALLDEHGTLLRNPAHHRGMSLAHIVEEVGDTIGLREIYELTGIQMMPVNTLFQLWAMTRSADPVLDAARTLLTVPDLFHYWLSGTAACELTCATTTQLIDPRQRGWARALVAALDLPDEILPPTIEPGTELGRVTPALADDLGGVAPLVIAPASHDTGSAVVAVPFDRTPSAFISSGTWSLVGTERTGTVITDASFDANLTNEGGFDGTVRLLHNVTGMWLLDQCREAWTREGAGVSAAEMIGLVDTASPFGPIIDPNDPMFLAPGPVDRRIADYCRRTEQAPPASRGEVVRCLLESLAVKYRQTIELLEQVTGSQIEVVHIVGGGARIAPLCQFTANALGRSVIAGPTEASAIGNLLVQAITLGEIDSLAQAREVVRRSFAVHEYEPATDPRWDEASMQLQEFSRQAGSRARV